MSEDLDYVDTHARQALGDRWPVGGELSTLGLLVVCQYGVELRFEEDLQVPLLNGAIGGQRGSHIWQWRSLGHF